MTDQELQQIAREYVKSLTEDNKYAPFDTELLITLNFLRWLTKTHCIVSREKVMQQCHDDKAAYDMNSGYGDYFEGYWGGRVDVYEDVFDTELFEGRSEE